MNNPLEITIDGFTQEEVSVIVEAAYYAMRHHYEDFAEHIDLADDHLQPIVSRFIELLDN
jgi:hypothetical protein